VEVLCGRLQEESPVWREVDELSRWSCDRLIDFNDGVLPRPYILDRAALHAYMMTMCT
jgi:hypothetical protein